ncbi:MAG: tRNA (N(6)-L-threonylcarbamoyladenosine(37)-C(2))-methylthiotransferase MtaB [Eubacterium sp.]|nr:tRNA (N(6)-L-threonylcarbamoyladenosine(37)-C(2))-methylthiotransferase MtaB [Eubacterium sp.]
MKVAFHTLGCKVNQYETEAMKEQFLKRGCEIVEETEFADIYIINTCSVTSLADRKSRQYIRRMKKLNPAAVVAVTGCYAQVNKEEVAAVEGVNLVVGTNEKTNIAQYVFHYIEENNMEIVEEHVLAYEELDKFVECGTTTSMETRTRANVKIQEGCNRFCSYCIIPYARGPVRSREIEEVIKECETLIEKGFKEIVLTGINTALCEHLDEILAILDNMPGEFRVRLSSLEPTVVNEEYVKGLFKYKRLCHHLHLSLQAGSNDVLKSMNRRYNRDEYLDIVKALKDFDENYGITTDIIVGFPGETDENFEDTMDIVEKSGFCKVHAFKYSKRSGTKAAEMTNQIDPSVKKVRSERLIEKAAEISDKFIENNIGTEREVLFEEYDFKRGALTGYTDNYIRVYLICEEAESKKYENQLVYVTINEAFADGVKVQIKS